MRETSEKNTKSVDLFCIKKFQNMNDTRIVSVLGQQLHRRKIMPGFDNLSCSEISRCLSVYGDYLSNLIADIVKIDDFNIRENGEYYHYYSILKTEKIEINLIYWEPGAYTYAHEHDGKKYLIGLISGKLEECVFKDGDGKGDWIPKLSEAKFNEDKKHAIYNFYDKPALSLHCYLG